MKHLQRVSSIIRGEQIAAYMGNARLNPDDGGKDDIYIYVKPHIKRHNDFKFEKHSYIDIHDGFDLRFILNKHPEVGCIVMSKLDIEQMGKYIKNKIVFIPHHHLNFERVRRNRTGIKVVGITGSIGALQEIPDELIEGLTKRGIRLEFFSTFYPRMAVSKFYSGIDIHMLWRKWHNRRLSTPVKITNAASFGVPTIAIDEPSFKEVEGAYIPVKTPEEWLQQLDYLIENPKKYKELADNCIEVSERYHISNIAKMYEELT